MPGCAIITCRARSQTAKGISFHRFPKEPDTRKKWIESTGRQNWIPTKLSTICSKHFNQNDYSVKNSGNKYLNYGAIPRDKVLLLRLFSDEESSSSSSTDRPRKRNCTETTDNIDDSKIKRVKVQQSGTPTQPTIPSITPNIEKLVQGLKTNEASSSSSSTDGPRIRNYTENTEDSLIMQVKVQQSVIPTLPTTPSITPKSEKRIQILQFNVPSHSYSNATTPEKGKLKQIITTKEAVIIKQRKQIKKYKHKIVDLRRS